jgi:hypothetical protein
MSPTILKSGVCSTFRSSREELRKRSKMRPAEREIDLKDRCAEYLAVGLDEDKAERTNKAKR